MKRSLFIALILAVGFSAGAQNVQLYRNVKTGTTLSFDYGRVWTYNLYERSRWGGGLEFSIRDSVVLYGFVGYGVRDQQWKGGVGASYKLPWSHHGGIAYLNIGRDYHAAASRRLKVSDITDISDLSSFMSQLMDDRKSVDAAYLFSVGRTTYVVEGSVFMGYKLYDSWLRPLYLVDGAELERSDGYELGFRMYHVSGFSAGAVVTNEFDWRLLAQYDRRFGIGPFYLASFAQAGICGPSAMIYYQFDLGGTYGSPLWFRNSMLTLRPYEYVAQYFAFGSLRLQFKKPLFSLWSKMFAVGTNPRPMIGASGTWGGRYAYGSGELTGGKNGALAAVELMAGVDGLIRWGVADYGVLFAVRPGSVEGARPVTVILVTASLTI